MKWKNRFPAEEGWRMLREREIGVRVWFRGKVLAPDKQSSALGEGEGLVG